MFIKVRIIIDMNPLKHMAVGGIHVQACQGDSSRDFEWEDADFCNFSGRTSKRTPFTGAHNVSEMGGDLILARNSMPQNLMKIELEVPGML